MTFVQVTDLAFPSMGSWWMALIRKGDHQMLTTLHRGFSRQFWILDGRDPHNQAGRDKGETIATLRHPLILAGHWLMTATKLFTHGDVLVSSQGGMRPREGSGLKELGTTEGTDWPPSLSLTRRISLTTWGNHWYPVCREIAFTQKFNTEQEAMDFAKLFALPTHITSKREARDFRAGD